jgi:hypothetical protein
MVDNILNLIHQGEIDITSDYCDSNSTLLSLYFSIYLLCLTPDSDYQKNIFLYHFPRSTVHISDTEVFSLPGNDGFFYCSQSGFNSTFQSYEY